MSRVMHFEIPADNPEKAIEFYGGVFGWTFNKWGDENYWLIGTGEGPGIDGGLMKKNPGQPMTNVIGVSDLDAFIGKVQAAGGVIVVPRMAIPTIGYLAYFKDLDDNIFGMMQIDANAQ